MARVDDKLVALPSARGADHGFSTVPSEPGSPALAPRADALVFSAVALGELRGLIAAVETERGAYEFAVLLVGAAGSQLVEHVVLLRNQRVSSVGFTAAPADVNQTVREALARYPGRAVLGIAHQHPGTGPSACFHSLTDDEFIADKLAPLLAAHVLVPRVWSRPLRASNEDGSPAFVLDAASRQRVRIARAGRRTGAAGGEAVLEVTEMRARVCSVVFTCALDFYCLDLQFAFPPLLTESGETEVESRLQRREIPVIVQPGDDVALPDVDDLRQQVRTHVLPSSGTYGWQNASSDSEPGAQPSQFDQELRTQAAAWAPLAERPSEARLPALYWASLVTRRREPTCVELVADAVVALREASRAAASQYHGSTRRVLRALKAATDAFEQLVDASWEQVQ